MIRSATDRLAQLALAAVTAALLCAPTARAADRCDPNSGTVYTPAQDTPGLVLFEETWPSNGDLAFNDQVVAYNYELLFDSSGNVVTLKATLAVLAVGATLNFGLFLHLPLPVATSAATVFDQNGNTVQPVAGESDLVIPIAANTRALFAAQDDPFINTVETDAEQDVRSLTFTVNFDQGVALDPSLAPFDLFIAHSDDYTFQTHLPQFPGTALMNTALFDTHDDNSNSAIHFVNQLGTPFALALPDAILWPQEGLAIDSVYGELPLFARSGGAQYPAWYAEDINQANAYTHDALNRGVPTWQPSGTSLICLPDAPSISYSPSALNCVHGSFCSLTPVNSGGAVTVFSISPALPNGLNIDPLLGTISGTPVGTLFPGVVYTVTATNARASSIALVTVTVNEVSCPGLDDGLAAYYTLDVSAADSSGNGLDATARNIVEAPGIIGQAAGYSESGAQIHVGGPLALNGTATFCAWVNPTAQMGLGLPIFEGGSPGAGDILGLGASGTQSGSCVGVSTTGPYVDHSGNSCVGSTTLSTQLNSWNFVCWAHQGNAELLYSNGVSATASSAMSNEDLGTFYIGANLLGGASTVAQFSGSIDEVAIWSRALSSAEMDAAYANGVGCRPPAVIKNIAQHVTMNALSYAQSTLACVEDLPCALAAPTTSGGLAVSYSISPALPDGLALDINTGAISGAPTAISPLANYTVTATNFVNSVTASVNVAVHDNSVTVYPSSVTVQAGALQQFGALINDSTSGQVLWSVAPGGAGGTIDASGVYAAPTRAGSDTVVATSPTDASKNGSATVNIVLSLPAASISLNPSSAVLMTGATQQFVASSNGSVNSGVAWSVLPAGAGSIDGAGNYTAPATAGIYSVIATSLVDSTQSAIAIVAVGARTLAISIAPSIASVPAGTSQRFVASVLNPQGGSSAVTWSVLPVGSGGTIDASGLYTAPASSMSGIQVIATSAADGITNSSASVTVPSLLIALNPSAAGLRPRATQRFTAVIKNDPTDSVNWSILEGSAGGAIDSTGLYSAPANAGTFHVVATSLLDATQATTAAIFVSNSAAVGPEGGNFVDAATGAAVQFPEGAIDSDTVVAVSRTSALPPLAVNAVSPVYQFEPDGRVFARPLTISLPMPTGINAASLYWSRRDGSGFDPIGGTIANGMITAQIPWFGQAVIGAPSATRTINGVGETTWISATARISEALDYSAQALSTSVTDGLGNSTTFAGAGFSDGTFVIKNVPTGNYTLQVGNTFVSTDSSAPDLGSLAGGVPAHLRTELTQASVLQLGISGLAAWAPGDFLEFAATEANDWDFNTGRFGALQTGDTSASVSFDVSQCDGNSPGGPPSLIASARGDLAVLAQEAPAISANGIAYTAMSTLGILPSFDLPPSGSTPLTVNMASAIGTNFSVDYRASQWAALLQDINPLQTPPVYSIAIEAQAGLPEDGLFAEHLDLLSAVPATGPMDVVTGAMNVAPISELPGNWSGLFLTQFTTRVLPLLPNTTSLGGDISSQGFFSGATWLTTLATGGSAPITPPISPVRAATVSGLDFFAGGSGVGASPTIQWTAPRTGTAVFYVVTIEQLTVSADSTATIANRVATLLVPGTSLNLPAGLLAPGGAYVFSIEAVASTSADGASLLASAPFKTDIDLATAYAVSGIFSP